MEIEPGFDYDLWANLAWIPHCDHPALRPVMEHIVRGQGIWLKRCGGEPPEDAGDLLANAEAMSAAWTACLHNANLQEVIHYDNLAGEPFSQQLGPIVRHVLNHGTYHRGQLRAMAEALGIVPFPETDYILFMRQRQP